MNYWNLHIKSALRVLDLALVLIKKCQDVKNFWSFNTCACAKKFLWNSCRVTFSTFFLSRFERKIRVNCIYSIIHLSERRRGYMRWPLLPTRGITWSVKLAARGQYGDHLGLLGDRRMGASYAGWLREALQGCPPRPGKDHTLRAPLLAWLA